MRMNFEKNDEVIFNEVALSLHCAFFNFVRKVYLFLRDHHDGKVD